MKTFHAKPTVEGAGVNLKRAFGYFEVPQFDPFLMLDHFGSEDPKDYLAGFPWHPHRGIETVTYMLSGKVEHGDSIGNSGVIGPGDIQWMTAGSGIVHQEMPKLSKPNLMGFQLWVNLPASKKMMGPRYRDIKDATVPEVDLEKGVKAKVISGLLGGVKGPVKDLVIDISYYDMRLAKGAKYLLEIPPDRKSFVYVYAGKGSFGKDVLTVGQTGLFEDVRQLDIKAQDGELKFITASGRSIGEPVAWGGPIVMNTDEELELAFEEYENGTFIKEGKIPTGKKG